MTQSSLHRVIIFPTFAQVLDRTWRHWVVHPFEWASSILSLLLFYLLLVIAIPIGAINQLRWPAHPKSAWNQVFRAILRVYFAAAGIRVEIDGVEHLPAPDQPVVLAANHRSHFDGFALDLATADRRATALIAPLHLFPWPFSLWFARIGSIDVGRTPEERRHYPTAHSGKAALKLAIWKLTTLRKSILVFPEGHIEHGRRVLPMKTGAVRMATAAGVPLLPLTMHGSERVFSPNKWLLRPGTIRIVIHPPLSLPLTKTAVDNHPLIETLTNQLLCTIASDLPPTAYTPGMIHACRRVLHDHPVTRAALTARAQKRPDTASGRGW